MLFQTSQDGDSTSITSGVENETKKSTSGLAKIKRNSIKKRVQSFSHDSDDGVVEPLLQKDKEKSESSSQSAKYLLSKTKTDSVKEKVDEKDMLLSENGMNTDNLNNGVSISYVSNTCTANTIHNHMNINVFSRSDGKKNPIVPKTQVLVEIDGNKPSTYQSGPLIFTTAKIHSDGKVLQMEPVHVTPVPIISTVEGTVIMSSSVNEIERKNAEVSSKTGNIITSAETLPKSTPGLHHANKEQMFSGLSNNMSVPNSVTDPLMSKSLNINDAKTPINITSKDVKSISTKNPQTVTEIPKAQTNGKSIIIPREIDVNKNFQTDSNRDDMKASAPATSKSILHKSGLQSASASSVIPTTLNMSQVSTANLTKVTTVLASVLTSKMDVPSKTSFVSSIDIPKDKNSKSNTKQAPKPQKQISKEPETTTASTICTTKTVSSVKCPSTISDKITTDKFTTSTGKSVSVPISSTIITTGTKSRVSTSSAVMTAPTSSSSVTSNLPMTSQIPKSSGGVTLSKPLTSMSKPVSTASATKAGSHVKSPISTTKVSTAEKPLTTSGKSTMNTVPKAPAAITSSSSITGGNLPTIEKSLKSSSRPISTTASSIATAKNINIKSATSSFPNNKNVPSIAQNIKLSSTITPTISHKLNKEKAPIVCDDKIANSTSSAAMLPLAPEKISPSAGSTSSPLSEITTTSAKTVTDLEKSGKVGAKTGSNEGLVKATQASGKLSNSQSKANSKQTSISTTAASTPSQAAKPTVTTVTNKSNDLQISNTKRKN